jgi:hypothetical protein
MIRKPLVLGILLVLLTTFCSNKEQQIKPHEQYSESQVPHTQPAWADKDDLKAVGVDGKLIKAFLIAYQDFLTTNDVPESKKKIEFYDLGLNQARASYEISFFPKRPVSAMPVIGGGSTQQAVKIQYQISKEDYKITRKYLPQ